MLQAARHGSRRIRDGEVVAVMSAAEMRVPLVRAARIYERHLLAWDGIGDPPDESLEAEAGAILEAEADVDLHELRDIASAWAEAARES